MVRSWGPLGGRATLGSTILAARELSHVALIFPTTTSPGEEEKPELGQLKETTMSLCKPHSPKVS